VGGNSGPDVLGLLRGTDISDGLIPLKIGTEESSKSPLSDLVIVEVGKLEEFSDGDRLPEVGVEQERHGNAAQQSGRGGASTGEQTRKARLRASGGQGTERRGQASTAGKCRETGTKDRRTETSRGTETGRSEKEPGLEERAGGAEGGPERTGGHRGGQQASKDTRVNGRDGQLIPQGPGLAPKLV
jgi:hypothetical protein